MKELGPLGGRATGPPPGSATAQILSSVSLTNKMSHNDITLSDYVTFECQTQCKDVQLNLSNLT